MFCDKTKEFLSQKNIHFEDRDITKDPAAFDELRKLKAMTTPVTVIDGEVIIGFDTEKLEQALAK